MDYQRISRTWVKKNKKTKTKEKTENYRDVLDSTPTLPTNQTTHHMRALVTRTEGEAHGLKPPNQIRH